MCSQQYYAQPVQNRFPGALNVHEIRLTSGMVPAREDRLNYALCVLASAEVVREGLCRDSGVDSSEMRSPWDNNENAKVQSSMTRMRLGKQRDLPCVSGFPAREGYYNDCCPQQPCAWCRASALGQPTWRGSLPRDHSVSCVGCCGWPCTRHRTSGREDHGRPGRVRQGT